MTQILGPDLEVVFFRYNFDVGYMLKQKDVFALLQDLDHGLQLEFCQSED